MVGSETSKTEKREVADEPILLPYASSPAPRIGRRYSLSGTPLLLLFIFLASGALTASGPHSLPQELFAVTLIGGTTVLLCIRFVRWIFAD